MPSAILLLAPLLAFAPAGDEIRVLDATLHHLGDSRVSWPDVPPEPEGARYDLAFESDAIDGEAVLFVRHRDVDNPWHVELNGVRVASLRLTKADGRYAYVLPTGSVVAGTNRLAVVCETTTDDIVLGDVQLDPRPLEVALDLGDVAVDVVDAATGEGLPARVTLARDGAEKPELYGYDPATTAVRPGLAYPKDGRLRAKVPSGTYTVYAGRGTEWSLGKARLLVRRGEVARARFELVREVDTTGWVSSDTHIHTLTFSGHGDSSIEERMITLAGEGVELAISTDHNHQTDYAKWQETTGMGGWYTSVTGNEVTTSVGHFNAFPLEAGGPRPDHELKDWVLLVDDIRRHGARVVILNHPRWPDGDDAPFRKFGFDAESGGFVDDRTLRVDGMEILNSTWLLDDAMEKFRDWFALLNRGVPIMAIGSSDSHTVGDPVGQGRTYVRSATDDPGALDVDALCDAFVEGRTSISVGIFAEIDVAGRGAGDVVPVTDDALHVRVRVAAPSWVRPREVLVFVNGVEVERSAIETSRDAPVDVTHAFRLARPRHDAWVAAVVLGDGVHGPHWPTMKDYTCAATNPVRLDVDGDGTFRWPRETAQRLLAETTFDEDGDWIGLLTSGVDQGVGTQLLDLAMERRELHDLFRRIATSVGPGGAYGTFIRRRLGG